MYGSTPTPTPVPALLSLVYNLCAARHTIPIPIQYHTMYNVQCTMLVMVMVMVIWTYRGIKKAN